MTTNTTTTQQPTPVDAFTGFAEAIGDLAGMWFAQGRFATLDEATDAAVIALTRSLTRAGSDIPARAVAAYDAGAHLRGRS